VVEWQKVEGLPEGHSAPLYETGKRVLKGHVGVLGVLPHVTVADTEHLLTQAKELQKEEDRLKTEFPSATKVMDSVDDGESTSSEGKAPHSHGTGDESESSGVLVDKEDLSTWHEDLVNDDTSKDTGKTSKTVEGSQANSSEGNRSET